MQHGPLPFHYEEENQSTGMTTWSGLPGVPGIWRPSRDSESPCAVTLEWREGTQGWTDAQMVTALVMLNLAGGGVGR